MGGQRDGRKAKEKNIGADVSTGMGVVLPFVLCWVKGLGKGRGCGVVKCKGGSGGFRVVGFWEIVGAGVGHVGVGSRKS